VGSVTKRVDLTAENAEYAEGSGSLSTFSAVISKAVFHAGLGATADENVGQVGNLSYKPISRAAEAGPRRGEDGNMGEAVSCAGRNPD
jgi:hypothetical protein